MLHSIAPERWEENNVIDFSFSSFEGAVWVYSLYKYMYKGSNFISEVIIIQKIAHSVLFEVCDIVGY